MPHGGSSPGKYYNSCTKADVNRGSYGKLSSDQLEERVELHARRKITGKPSVAEIATHWMDKYNIEMTYQSEKTWCNTQRNADLIESKRLEMVEEQAVDTMSARAMMESLAESARSNAKNCQKLKTRLNAAMNEELTVWGVLGLTRDEFNLLRGPKRKQAEVTAKLMMDAKVTSLKLAAGYSKAHIEMSKEFRANVKEAYDMAKYAGLFASQSARKQLTGEAQAQIEDVKDGESVAGQELVELDPEKVRKQLGYDDK